MKLNLAELDLTVSPQRLFTLRKQRVECPSCHFKYQYFCRDCNRLLLQQHCEQNNLDIERFQIPEIKLPIQITILQSTLEKKKDSSVQYVAPLPVQNLKVVEFADQFSQIQPGSLLLMPSETAVDAAEVDFSKFSNCYILDCKWSQCQRLQQTSPELFACQNVVLTGFQSSFWRPHGRKFDGCLSTIECMYFMCKLADKQLRNSVHLDDVLTFYANNILLVKKSMKEAGRKTLLPNCKSAQEYEDWDETVKQLAGKWQLE